MEELNDKKVLMDHEEPSGICPSAPPEYVVTAPAPPAYSILPPGTMAYPATTTPPAATVYPPATPPPGAMAYPTTATPPAVTAYPQALPPPEGTGYPGTGPPSGVTVYPPRTPAPAPVAGSPVGTEEQGWEKGILDFRNDEACFLAFFCPCYLIGLNAEALGEPFCLYTIASFCCPFIMHFMIRNKLRKQLGIEGSEVGDIFTICCCQPCASAQEQNEILSAISWGEITPQVIVRQ